MNYIKKFELSVKKNEDKIAIVDNEGERSISYLSLDILSGKIANKLHKSGVKKGDRVIVYMHRNIEYVATTLGILKAGAVIVPTVHDYPKERIDYIKNISEAKYIIEEDFVKDINKYDIYEDLANDKDGAIIYFTSGSTGNPKGILHTNYDLSNATDRHSIYFAGIDNIITACMTLFSFGMYLFDFFYALYYGATIHILSDNVRKDITKIEEYYKKHNITLCFLSPQQLRLFKSQSKSLKRVVTGSERVINAFSKDYETYVLYGSTEAMVGFTYFKVDKNYDNTPIGKVLDGLTYYILDDNGKKVKTGDVGELCIEYDTYSSYYKDNEKTKKIFEKLPNGKVLYHTGDLVLENEDKNLVFVNRKDFMVKINGQRVEPYEIESIMQNVENIKNAVVKAFEDENKQTYLVGYYESEKDLKNIIDENLKQKLPYYMIPRYLVRLDMMPKNANGKIDRLSLLPPDINLFKNEYIAPRNEIEKTICDAFSKILSIEKVGINDDFIKLGGDSISLMRFMEICPLNCITINNLFKYRTAKKLAKFCEEMHVNEIDEIDKKNKIELAKPQMVSEEMASFISTQVLYQDSTLFNTPTLVEMEKSVDADLLAKAVDKVFKSHPALNTKIIFDENNKWLQAYSLNEYKNIEIKEIKEEEFIILKDNLIKSLDDFGVRKCIYKTEKSLYLFFDIHHIFTDGISINIIIKQIIDSYKDINCLIPIDYYYLITSEYRKNINETKKEAIKTYINDKYNNLIINKNYSFMPKVDNNIENSDRNDFVKDFSIDKNKFLNNRFFSEVGGNVFYMGAYALAVAKYNETKDMIFEWLYNGRDSHLKANAVGLFLKYKNMFVTINEDDSIEDYFNNIKEQVNFAIANNDVNFEVDDISIDKYSYFRYQKDIHNLERYDLIEREMEVKNPSDLLVSPFSIKIIDSKGIDKLVCDIEYTINYKKESIDKFFKIYDEIVQKLIKIEDVSNYKISDLLKDNQ